jgi:hypothetical protein
MRMLVWLGSKPLKIAPKVLEIDLFKKNYKRKDLKEAKL